MIKYPEDMAACDRYRAECAELPWLPVPARETTKPPEQNGISHRINLMRECLQKLDEQYQCCKKPVEPEFYYLVRNMAKYLIEQAESE